MRPLFWPGGPLRSCFIQSFTSYVSNSLQKKMQFVKQIQWETIIPGRLLNSLCKWGHFEKAKTTFKMLLATWFFVCFFKRFRSFVAENLKSVGQRAPKLPAIKLWEWLDRDRESNPGRLADWGRGRPADFFLRPPTLTASNFAAVWPTDPKFLAIKDLLFFLHRIEF